MKTLFLIAFLFTIGTVASEEKNSSKTTDFKIQERVISLQFKSILIRFRNEADLSDIDYLKSFFDKQETYLKNLEIIFEKNDIFLLKYYNDNPVNVKDKKSNDRWKGISTKLTKYLTPDGSKGKLGNEYKEKEAIFSFTIDSVRDFFIYQFKLASEKPLVPLHKMTFFDILKSFIRGCSLFNEKISSRCREMKVTFV